MFVSIKRGTDAGDEGTYFDEQAFSSADWRVNIRLNRHSTCGNNSNTPIRVTGKFQQTNRLLFVSQTEEKMPAICSRLCSATDESMYDIDDILICKNHDTVYSCNAVTNY